MKLSANLGFLWTELPLPEAIGAAATAGFGAVECHWPYELDPTAVRAALAETGVPMVGLNTRRGDPARPDPGDFGLAAVPGREAEARAGIDEAVAYAAAIGCANVHVMAGRAEGPDARRAFTANLAYAADQALPHGVGILIEPINSRDAPGYFLSRLEDAATIVAEVRAPNLTIMFDCYHLQIMGGDLLRRFEAHLPLIGHVQFAGVPDRAEPDRSEVDYRWLLPRMVEAGYTGWFGAEYRPAAATADGLGWLGTVR